MPFNPDLMNLILFWIGGVAAVQSLTQKLKGLWKRADSELRKVLNYSASIAVSLIICGLFLFLNDSFTFKKLFLYAIPVWMTATGLYDAYRQPKSK